jgi:Tol biopolymer transport system component
LRIIRKSELKGILGLTGVALILAFIFFALTGQVTRWTGIRFTFKKPLTNQIVFVSDRNGHPNIWVMDQDGSNQRALTNGSYEDSEPIVGPDGYSIVFTSRRDTSYNELYAMDPDGTHAHRISNITGSKSSPRFTADGQYIIFLCAGSVWKVEAGQDNPDRLLPTHEMEGMLSPEVRAPYIWASESPDGKLLSAIQSTEDAQLALWMKPTDEVAKPITDESRGAPVALTGELVNGAWAGDSDKLAITLTDRSGSGALVTADLEAGSVTPLAPGAYGSPEWSPDSSTIVVEALKRTAPGQYDSTGLVSFDAYTPTPQRMVEGEAKRPRWSPDGKRIVYTNGGDVYSLDVESKKITNLTKGKGANSDPTWAPPNKK